MRQKGEAAIADEIQAVDTMRRHVDRELARARLRGGVPLQGGAGIQVAPLVRSLIATLSRTQGGERIRYDAAIPENVLAPFDRTDLAEVLGNLLENATRHARTGVRIVAQASDDGLAIMVEDDGPGIAEGLRPVALARGGRLDERPGGSGLGLAIVQDVLEAYGWTLQLQGSQLGGLKAEFGKRAELGSESSRNMGP